MRDTWLRSPDAISLTFAPADDAHPPSLPVSRDAVFNVAQALGATMIERGRSAINAQELVLRFADGSQVELDVVLELDDDAFDLDDERLDDARAVAWRTGRTGWNNTIDGSPARVAAVLDSLVEDLGPIVVSAMFRDPVVVDGRRPWIDAFL
ncbi:MAG: hypothetical protein M5U28_30935 [Sandaracinaceae bacterium]|nr:hypothetical protein [Sandaracinaceae bacterium]